jgi:hypothetical protein
MVYKLGRYLIANAIKSRSSGSKVSSIGGSVKYKTENYKTKALHQRVQRTPSVEFAHTRGVVQKRGHFIASKFSVEN